MKFDTKKLTEAATQIQEGKSGLTRISTSWCVTTPLVCDHKNEEGTPVTASR
jgi:hypothetical protein